MIFNLNLKPEKVDLVIYHGNCSDGFGAALSAYEYFKTTNGINENGKNVEYFGASFNQLPPNVKDKNVLICDFSYKEQIILQMIKDVQETNCTLAIIDHHKSSEAELKNIPQQYKYFDMLHSGAYLTWKFFNQDIEDVPLLIKYIEDNDIWIKKMPFTEEMTFYIYSLPFKFEEYSTLLNDNEIKTVAIPIGTGMKRANDNYIKHALNTSTHQFIEIDDKYFLVEHLNSTILKSEIGNKILTKFPYADFSAIYSTYNNVTTLSLRSMNDRADVSVIATKFGGGGHRNASGMSVYNSNNLPTRIIDTGSTYKLLESSFINIHEIENGVQSSIIKILANGNVNIIGKYMLQTISNINLNGTTVDLQKCCNILRTKLQNQNYYSYFNACLVKSHSLTKCHQYNLYWLDINLSEKIIKIFSTFFDMNHINNDKKLTFSTENIDELDDKLKILENLFTL